MWQLHSERSRRLFLAPKVNLAQTPDKGIGWKLAWPAHGASGEVWKVDSVTASCTLHPTANAHRKRPAISPARTIVAWLRAFERSVRSMDRVRSREMVGFAGLPLGVAGFSAVAARLPLSGASRPRYTSRTPGHTWLRHLQDGTRTLERCGRSGVAKKNRFDTASDEIGVRTLHRYLCTPQRHSRRFLNTPRNANKLLM